MANVVEFLNWYRRYRVRAVDMNDFGFGLSDLSKGLAEGIVQSAVLDGFDLTLGGGLNVTVSDGLATGPSGYLHYSDAASGVACSAPGSNRALGLIVARPLLVDDEIITSPTAPFSSVPLKTLQKTQLAFIPGTAATQPEYPAKEANDCILAGVRLVSGQVSLSLDDLDFSVRDALGRNSLVHKNTFHFDSRLQCLRETYKTVSIKPSQSTGSQPKVFTYAGKGTPSLFPKDGSNLFNEADTLLDFETGVITGGDAQSPDFTPTIPSAGNAIVATLTLKGDDTLGVLYGTEGTRAQCLNAIKNQVTSGAGSINAASGSYKIAYVLIESTAGGGALASVQVFDARPLGGGSGGAGGVSFDLFSDDEGNGALDQRIFGQKVLTYTPTFQQMSRGVVKVPSGYSQGSPIKIKISAHTPATSGSELKDLAVSGALIRKDVDACGSTSNVNVSSVQFSGVPTANRLQEKTADLTTAAGLINSLPVNPGDEIEVYIKDAATGFGDDLHLRAKAVEVTFS